MVLNQKKKNYYLYFGNSSQNNKMMTLKQKNLNHISFFLDPEKNLYLIQS